MAGNSKRQGATRKAGSKKAATVGSGGRGRRALEGKGPTPKAEDRPYHAAHKRKVAEERRAVTGTQRDGGPAAAAPRSRQRDLGSRTKRTGVEIVAGRNPVVEALRAGVPCAGVWMAHQIDADDRVREIRQVATDRRLPYLEVTRAELDRLTDGLAHQGVAMQVPAYQYADVQALLSRAKRTGRPPLLVALDGVTDPRNLGAVLRSAGAFGAHGVVVPERRAAGVTAAAWKVSAGAAARVPVARVTNLTRALGDLRSAGCAIVGLDGGGTMPVGDLTLAEGPVVLVVGSEGKGLGRLVRQTCDVIAAIPIAGEVESLNAGVAAGIALYEVARQRQA
jgi:23S rRNA (guanosine2251-2'-O)-methyltransferase